MKERPILFSAPMVNAILDGEKTMTRRVVKPQPDHSHWEFIDGYELLKVGPIECHDGRACCSFHHTIPQNDNYDEACRSFCPYGAEGGRLWVRETWGTDALYDAMKPSKIPNLRGSRQIWYATNGEKGSVTGKTRPSIFMCRWMSRISLEITGIRVERVQDISAKDVEAEGVDVVSNLPLFMEDRTKAPQLVEKMAQHLFQELWDSINGKTYPWKSNPWVWVIEFKRV